MKLQLVPVLLLLSLSFSCKKSTGVSDGFSNAANRSVGASARELLTAGAYTSLKIEVQYMPGFAPDAAALVHLQNFLSAYLNKPAGISITTREISGSSGTAVTIDDVRITEQKNRTAFSTGSQMAVYILYTNGTYTDNNVLGIAYRNTSAVLFGKKIHDNSGGLGQASRTKLEATVLEHEMGHLLGLVDIGSPMQTAHKANGSHCTNQNCLLYYASETSDILGFLVTGSIPQLDAACAADLSGNGGK